MGRGSTNVCITVFSTINNYWSTLNFFLCSWLAWYCIPLPLAQLYLNVSHLLLWIFNALVSSILLWSLDSSDIPSFWSHLAISSQSETTRRSFALIPTVTLHFFIFLDSQSEWETMGNEESLTPSQLTDISGRVRNTVDSDKRGLLSLHTCNHQSHSIASLRSIFFTLLIYRFLLICRHRSPPSLTCVSHLQEEPWLQRNSRFAMRWLKARDYDEFAWTLQYTNNKCIKFTINKKCYPHVEIEFTKYLLEQISMKNLRSNKILMFAGAIDLSIGGYVPLPAVPPDWCCLPMRHGVGRDRHGPVQRCTLKEMIQKGLAINCAFSIHTFALYNGWNGRHYSRNQGMVNIVLAERGNEHLPAKVRQRSEKMWWNGQKTSWVFGICFAGDLPVDPSAYFNMLDIRFFNNNTVL